MVPLYRCQTPRFSLLLHLREGSDSNGLIDCQNRCLLVSIFVTIFSFIARRLAVSVTCATKSKRHCWLNFASYASMIVQSSLYPDVLYINFVHHLCIG